MRLPPTHDADRAVPAFAVVDPVTPVQHDGRAWLVLSNSWLERTSHSRPFRPPRGGHLPSVAELRGTTHKTVRWVIDAHQPSSHAEESLVEW